MKLAELLRGYASNKKYSIPIGVGLVVIALVVAFSGGGGSRCLRLTSNAANFS